MKLKLNQCATVNQGVILSRTETQPGSDTKIISLYTMKEMNASIGLEYRLSSDKPQDVHVKEDLIGKLPISKEGMVLINLTSQKAISVRPEHAGRLIPSNFVVVEPNGNLSPHYFEWYFNEHPSCQKQLRIATQGTIISALSIQMLRSLEIEVPSLKEQKLMGEIYRLTHEKKRLINERLQLEEQLTRQLLLDYLKEEK